MAKDAIKNKQHIYAQVFSTDLAKTVLSDLRLFCHATKTTAIQDEAGKIDIYQMMRLEGRREVFLQIMNMIKVDFEDYYHYEEEFSEDDY